MEYKHQAILCVVNAGYTDAVMEAAREHGARGGTVIHARGTANQEAEKLFNITVQPDKDIVMIIVESEIKDKVLHGLYQKAGLKTAGQGIAFCLPIEDVVGLSPKVDSAKTKVDDAEIAATEKDRDQLRAKLAAMKENDQKAQKAAEQSAKDSKEDK